jgi:hypothetical protein
MSRRVLTHSQASLASRLRKHAQDAYSILPCPSCQNETEYRSHKVGACTGRELGPITYMYPKSQKAPMTRARLAVNLGAPLAIGIHSLFHIYCETLQVFLPAGIFRLRDCILHFTRRDATSGGTNSCVRPLAITCGCPALRCASGLSAFWFKLRRLGYCNVPSFNGIWPRYRGHQRHLGFHLDRMLGRCLLPSNHRELQQEIRRWTQYRIHHHLAG